MDFETTYPAKHMQRTARHRHMQSAVGTIWCDFEMQHDDPHQLERRMDVGCLAR